MSENRILTDVEGLEEPSWSSRIGAFCQWVLDREGISGWEVSVLLCDPDTMAGMNHAYRGKDGPTDVLSFAQMDGDDEGFGPQIPLEDGDSLELAGDIVVCPEQVRSNADAFGVSFDEEMKRVLIHGLLHLAGMDHETNEPGEPMLVRQEELLGAWTDGERFSG